MFCFPLSQFLRTQLHISCKRKGFHCGTLMLSLKHLKCGWRMTCIPLFWGAENIVMSPLGRQWYPQLLGIHSRNLAPVLWISAPCGTRIHWHREISLIAALVARNGHPEDSPKIHRSQYVIRRSLSCLWKEQGLFSVYLFSEHTLLWITSFYFQFLFLCFNRALLSICGPK